MSGVRRFFKPKASTTSSRQEQGGSSTAGPSTSTSNVVVVRTETTEVQRTESEYVAIPEHQPANAGDYAFVSTSIVLDTLKDVGSFVPGLSAVAGMGILVLGKFEAMNQNNGTFKSVLNQLNGLVICLDHEARNLQESGETIPHHFQEQTELFHRHLESLQRLVAKYQDEKRLKRFLLSDEVKGQLEDIRASIGEMLDHFQIRDSFANQTLLASWLKERGYVREELADIKESLAVLKTTTSTKEVATIKAFANSSWDAGEDLVITSHSFNQGSTNYDAGVSDQGFGGAKGGGKNIKITYQSHRATDRPIPATPPPSDTLPHAGRSPSIQISPEAVGLAIAGAAIAYALACLI